MVPRGDPRWLTFNDVKRRDYIVDKFSLAPRMRRIFLRRRFQAAPRQLSLENQLIKRASRVRYPQKRNFFFRGKKEKKWSVQADADARCRWLFRFELTKRGRYA